MFKELSSNINNLDLHKFDGNPQGFRLIRLLSGNDEFGLNLTCSLLLSTVKYPYTIDKIQNNEKIGIFKLCYPSYQEACKKSIGRKENTSHLKILWIQLILLHIR